MVANECFQVLGGFWSVVERHLGEEVVDNVEVSDVVEEESSLPSKDRSVNGGSGTSLEVPFLSAVVGHDGVGVVQVGDHDEPVTDAKPWDAVVLSDLRSAPDRARVADPPNHGGNTEVGHNHSVALGLGEQDGVGVKVVCPFRVGLLAGYVEEQVSRERQNLLPDQHIESVDGGVSEDLLIVEAIVVFWKPNIGPSLWDINLIPLH